MNDNTAKPAARQQGDRTPIRIEKLLFSPANPHGIKLPDGLDGANERITPNLTAGVHGSVKIEIDYRPWMRAFRVVKSRKVTSTGKDGKEAAAWQPMGRPFLVPESWAVAILAEE